MFQNKAKAGKHAAILSMLLLLVFMGLPVAVGMLLTHPPKLPVALPVSSTGLKITPVSFNSSSGGLALEGWFIPSENSNKTIIFAHGYAKNRLQEDVPAIDIAKALNADGYNILMFDFRSNGESEGNLTSLGQYEKEDLKSAVDYVKNSGRPGEHVGVIGFSMGAATALVTAGEDNRIEAVVADAPFANLKNYLEQNLSVWTHLPSYPFTPVILGILPGVLGLEPETVNPLQAMPKIKGPVLLIHGTGDKHIPISNSISLYKASPAGKRLWIVEGAPHVGCYKTKPDEYVKNVLALFSQMK